MFLARNQIAKLIAERGLILNYKEEYLRQSSYDLRLGEEVYLVGKDAPERLSKHSPYVRPHGFYCFAEHF
jgi:deoxycytidine triphosphate deaminase